MSRFRFRLVLLLFALLLGSMGLASFRSHRIESAWRQMTAVGRDLERTLDEADHRRPILYGASIEGSAHDAYNRADGLLGERAEDDLVEVRRLAEKQDGSDINLRNVLIAQHRDLLAALTLGAHHTDGYFPIDWSEGWNAHLPKLMRSRTIADLAVLAAERSLDDGKPEDAVDILLDTMQYGRDLLPGPTQATSMIGYAVIERASNLALIDGGLLERIPPAQLERLAAGMGRLEEGLPSYDSLFAGDMALFVRSLELMEDTGSNWNPSGGPIQVSPRNLFSKRLVVANFVTEFLSLQDLARTESNHSWPELCKVIHERLDLLQEQGNQIGHPMYGNLISILQSKRTFLARFRMARTAVEYRLSGQVLALGDPFGDELQTTLELDSLRVASVGPEGQDSEGIYSLEMTRRND